MFFHSHAMKGMALFIVCLATSCGAHRPPYQVTLYVQLLPWEAPVHFCNGVIVQSQLVLTTATCVHYKFSSSKSPAIPMEPHRISVASGTASAFTEELRYEVADIFVAEKFNSTTGENDLALLRLKGILPLDSRPDISWITLEDDGKYDSPCVANFDVQTVPNGPPSYIQSEQLPILDSGACRTPTEPLTERGKDICSFYYLPPGVDCNAADHLQNYSRDRGTGLLCGNKLIGLLSTILPPQNVTECIEKPLRAYYTAVVPLIAWIFNIITEEDLKMLKEGEYISSMPYAGETSAVVEPHVTEFSAAPIYTTPTHLQTTQFLVQENAPSLSSTHHPAFSTTLVLICLMLHAIMLPFVRVHLHLSG